MLPRVNPTSSTPKLAIVNGTGVNGSGLKHIKSLTSVQRLYLTDTQIDDESLAALSALGKLRLLDISMTPIGDDGLKHLKDLTGVKGGGPPSKAELLHNPLLKPDRA